jgi:hypothetical protein
MTPAQWHIECYAESHLCLESFMLSVTIKQFMVRVIMVNVVMLSVIMLNVVAPSARMNKTSQ